MSWSRNIVVVVVAVVMITAALAWITSDTNVGFAQRAGSNRLTCIDFRGAPVTYVSDATVQDIAVASYAPNGAPIVRVNPGILLSAHPQTQTFFMAHECGHHVLAHTIRNIPFTQEQEADCFAIVQLVQQGMLSLSEISIVQNDIARFARADWQHLPGPIRAINLQRCLQGATAASSTKSDSCRYANDGECDEPDVCDPGTDTADCSTTARSRRRVETTRNDSCQYANDGECDEPNVCDPGTDTTDCSTAARPRRRAETTRDDSCQYANDGECDEPNVCSSGTDTTDCSTATRSRRRAATPREQRPTVLLCQTAYGSCAMVAGGVPGTQCFCATASGPIAGMISY